MDVLLTWVGARDPGWQNPRTRKSELGPILFLLQNRRFDVVHLLFNLDSNVDDFRRRATEVLRICQRDAPSIQVRQKPVDLVSVTDYREIFLVVNDTCQRIVEEEGREAHQYYVYLSPGTPQMQTIWVLLVQSGLLSARMIQATSPDLLSPGAPPWREVDLSIPEFPQVVNPNETARLLGVLQAQKDNLETENRRLQAQVDLLNAGSSVQKSERIVDGFRLRDYLLAHEKALYIRALDQAGERRSDAARLLGIAPAAFRARAAALGIRHRSKYRADRT